MCSCGCNTCETKIKGPLLTEGKVKSLLSEGLQYHIDKQIPLFETVYQETVGKFVKQGAGQIDQFADGAGDQIDAYGKKIRDKVETTINNVTTTNNANNPNNPLTAQELTDAFTNGYVNGSRIISNGRPSTSNNSPFSNNSMSNSLIRRDYIFGSDFEIKDN